ncbi:MAG: polysaccharide pyruvyl transferase family protein, partial [Verrucomicrobia bacterium]|nr:polysaccharide pyruvyl transferase family protein [Verrucomicrobiota bacterium]
ALASGTVTSVINCFPGAEVFLLDYGYEPARYKVHGPNGPMSVELVNIRFSKKIYLSNNIARLLLTAMLGRLLPETWRCRMLAKNPSLRRLLDADVIASIAGGDSFSDIYGLPRLLYVALPQLLALQLKKPLVLLPQTLGPFKGAVAKYIAGYIMRTAVAVYSRDKNSFDEAGALLGDRKGKLTFSHDMAFAMEPSAPAPERLQGIPLGDGRPLVGLNVSGLLLMGGYTRDNMFGLKASYPELIRRIVLYFVQQKGARVVLVPHVFGNQGEGDPPACEQVFRELSGQCDGRLHVLQGAFNQHEIKHVIGRCDFFLGARMHACIAAVSQGVPAVCMAYSRKFAGVLESIGSGDLVVDLRACDLDQAMAAIDRLYAARTSLSDSLKKTIPGVRDGVLRLFLTPTLGLSRSNGPAAASPRPHLAP